jgi:alpha-1,6-mannosyltransferase
MGFERDRSKLAAALASADALVHGCPHETFGFAIAEAMSVGLPVVVPDAGGAGELADSRSAERYAAGDAAAAAIAVARMLARVHADRCGMRNNAQRAADKLCTVEEQFARTYAVYGELLDATRRRG